MRQYFAPLLFGLLGGLATFVGGLSGEVQLSVLLTRSLIAIVLAAIFGFAILFYISKSLFPEYKFFEERGKRPPKSTTRVKNTAKPTELPPDNSEEATLIAAAERHPKQEESVEGLEQKIQSEVNSIEGQLRNADSRELANIVRHSINEE